MYMYTYEDVIKDKYRVHNRFPWACNAQHQLSVKIYIYISAVYKYVQCTLVKMWPRTKSCSKPVFLSLQRTTSAQLHYWQLVVQHCSSAAHVFHWKFQPGTGNKETGSGWYGFVKLGVLWSKKSAKGSNPAWRSTTKRPKSWSAIESGVASWD